MTTLIEAFPVLGLRVTAGPIELTGADDDTLIALANLAFEGIHASDALPFLQPWTLRPAGDFERNFVQYHWGVRSRFAPEAWSLELAVRYEGELVGMQGVGTEDFLLMRTGETGSWLGRRYQGRGIGTLMRQAMCAFLFDHLDFSEITSAAFSDNPASQAVSRKVGYRDNGANRKLRPRTATAAEPGQEVATERRFVLAPSDLVRGPELSVEGVEPLRRLIGLEAST